MEGWQKLIQDSMHSVPRPLYSLTDYVITDGIGTTWTSSVVNGGTNSRDNTAFDVGNIYRVNTNAAAGVASAKLITTNPVYSYGQSASHKIFQRMVADWLCIEGNLGAAYNATSSFMGFARNTNTPDGTTQNIVGFRTDTSGNIITLTDNGGTETTNTSATLLTTLRRLTIAIRDGYVDFWIDGSTSDINIGKNPTYTHSTDIPRLLSAYFGFHCEKTAASANSSEFDVASIRIWTED